MSCTAQRQARSAAGIARVLSKLKISLESGNFYEAHQMYRTLYFRYCGQNRYVELEEMLYEGTIRLFQNGQCGSGADLAKLYVDVLVKGKMDPKEVVLERITKLYSLIPISLPDKEIFLSQAIKWSLCEGRFPHGHPRLHQLIAYELWNMKRYSESRQHFLYSSDGLGCGSMLAEFQVACGFPRELDIFIAGTVLQMLCLQKHIVAALALKAYTENHPSIHRGPPYKHPLLNFVWLLLLAIEHKQSVNAFGLLVEKYKTSLVRDPSFMSYLDKIGQHFFDLPAPSRPKPGGMLSDMFDSIFNVLNDDDDEDVEQLSASSAGGAKSKKKITSATTMKHADLD